MFDAATAYFPPLRPLGTEGKSPDEMTKDELRAFRLRATALEKRERKFLASTCHAASVVLQKRAAALQRGAARNARAGKDNGARSKTTRAEELLSAASLIRALPTLPIEQVRSLMARAAP
jgi:hypothetical protein